MSSPCELSARYPGGERAEADGIDDNERAAGEILAALGGRGNIGATAHCATRLRITVVDAELVDDARLSAADTVLGIAHLADQVQVVVGPARVDALHAELARQLSEASLTLAPPSRRLLRPVYVLMDIVSPLLPTFVAGGLLLALHNLLSAPGIFGPFAADEAAPWLSGFSALVGILGIGVFTLLPVLIGFSAATRFGANAYLGAAMGAALVAAPFIADSGALPALHIDGGGSWAIGGVDVLGIDYRGTVIPIIAVVFVLAHVERAWTRVLPGTTRFLLVPMLTLLVTGILAFLVVGPAVRWIGDIFADVVAVTYAASGVLGGAVFGALYPLLVVTGTHQSLVSLELGLLADGGSFIFPIAGIANLAQAGACFAVAVLAQRRTALRSLAAGAGGPALFGIAEPAIFGITLRLRFPLIAAVAASAVGGALLAAGRVEATSLGAAGIAGVASIAPGYGGAYLVCGAVSIAIAFVATCVWGLVRRRRGTPLT